MAVFISDPGFIPVCFPRDFSIKLPKKLNKKPLNPSVLRVANLFVLFFEINALNLGWSSSRAIISGFSEFIAFLTSFKDCFDMWEVPRMWRFLYLII